MEKTKRNYSKVTLRDWHDGPHAVHVEVSLVAHLYRMASEEKMSVDHVTRALIAESPLFREYMRGYWAQVSR